MIAGDIYSFNKGSLSGYQPEKWVTDFTAVVQRDYSFGHDILTKTWPELNNRSVIDDENRGQLMFNAFVDTSVEDPAEAWKWRGTRSKARNKGIATHANLTAKYLLPMFTAQNEDDEVDLDFSETMSDCIEWLAQPINSNYQESFLQVAFGMLTNPVTYMGAEFCEVMQTVRERQADGSISTKEIPDEVLSGFQAPIYSSTQIMITNAYERNMQKQRSRIKRRWVDKTELEAKWGQHPNWAYVMAGQRSIYNQQDGLFYDIKDITHPNLCEEVTWGCRRDDTEVVFISGIYMGDIDSLDNNPFMHRDNRGAPKYNEVPFGYSRIGEHFFFYKSQMNIMQWDNALYDALSEITMNRMMLEVDMPVAVSGSDKIDSDVVFPKSVVTFEDPNTRITPLLPQGNTGGAMNALSMTSQAMDDESISAIASGQMPGGKQTAYTVSSVNAAAQKIIDEVGKSLGESVAKYGDLMKDIVINHITSPEVQELTSGALQLKYKSFFLDNKNIGGKMGSKHIHFDANLIGAEMSDDEKKMANIALLEQAGWPQKNTALIKINPELFARYKYLSRVDLEEMINKNGDYWKPILTQLYTLLAQDPLADREWLLHKLGYAFFQREGDDLIKKNPQGAPGMMPPQNGQQTPPPPGQTGAVPQTTMGNMAVNSALSTANVGATAAMR